MSRARSTPLFPPLPAALLLLVPCALLLPSPAASAASGGWGPRMGDLPLGAGEQARTLLGGELGYEEIDDQQYLGLLLLGSYRGDRLRLGLELPLRLDLQHEGLRREDWDEAADYARILRLAELGEPGDAVHLRLGELTSATLGHGTLLAQYFGVLDPDRPHAGVGLDGHAGRVGGEALLDDLLAPALLGGRLFLQPRGAAVAGDGAGGTGQAGTGPGWVLGERLQLGASLLADLSAPTALVRRCLTPAGSAAPAPSSCPAGQAVLQPDGTGAPRVAASAPLVLAGADVTLGLVEQPALQLLGYTDANAIVEHGTGLHAGLMLALRPAGGFQGGVRLEYRYAGAGYRPGYVDTLYELERYGRQGQPRAALLDHAPAGHGGYGELALGVERLFSLAAIWEQQQGDGGGTLTLHGEVPGPGPLRAGVFYRVEGVDRAARAFRLGDSFLVTELRAQVTPLFYLGAHYGRLWRLAVVPRADDPYRSAAFWGAGGGISAVF